jgi:catechol 2,3-dioxygenase-like lactoylglutathione lyase family enzyme
MLAHCNLIAFMATAQPEEATRFYSEVLGLRLIEDSPFALVFDANGMMLRIQKVETLNPAGYTTLGWHVGDIQEAHGKDHASRSASLRRRTYNIGFRTS